MSSDSSTTEHAFAQRIRAGDASAFESLIEQHYSSLLTYLIVRTRSPDDAEDLLQDLFVRLWRRREDIDISSGFRAYLFGAARNQLLNYQRSKRRKQQVEHALAHTILFEIPAETVAAELDREALIHALDIALAELPDRAREVWELHRDHHLTYPEIAAMLGLSVNTVKSHMSRAMAGIRTALGPFLILLFATLP